MDEMITRLLQTAIAVGYFILAVIIAVAVMKFFGKHLLKIANFCMISFLPVGIIGGWIEWIITGNKDLFFSNVAENIFVSGIALYLMAFLAYIFFYWDNQEDVCKI